MVAMEPIATGAVHRIEHVEHAALLYPGTPGGGPVRRRPPFNRGETEIPV